MVIKEMGFLRIFNRWRVFLQQCEQSPDHVSKMIYAAVLLHNIILERRPKEYLRTTAPQNNPDAVCEAWADQQVLDGLQRVGRRDQDRAVDVRDHLCDYFNSAKGSLRWQDKAVDTMVSWTKKLWM